MKTVIVMMAALMFCCQQANAQCGKTVKWTTTHTKFIDTSGNVQRDQDEEVLLTIADGKLSILPHSDSNDEMTGDITDYACKWTDAKTGVTTFKSVVSDPRGDVKHMTITIKGDGKKIMITVQLEEMDGLRAELDDASFEEE